MLIRIGNGFDVHRFAQNRKATGCRHPAKDRTSESRKLILGGVDIPYDIGLEGHSDADVLCHSIADSLLGSLALGDIGQFFPDTDPKYKGMNSLLLLKEVYHKVQALGYNLINCDSTIICQKPKLAPYIDEMKGKIASVLEISRDMIGIKATTTERLGFCGRGEGIATLSVALIQR